MTEKLTVLQKIKSWILDNIVTVIILLFTLFGFVVSDGVTPNFYLSELSERFFRNALLILSLIIPVVAGLGLNFGIVIGAMSGQIAIIFVRYHGLGGLGGLLLALLITLPLAIVFGFFTGKLYNKTRGQEMIASLIVSYFADGLYQFLMLFVIGVIIPVRENHPMINPSGIGVRNTVDLSTGDDGGLKYALDGILQVPFAWFIIIAAAALLVASLAVYLYRRGGRSGGRKLSLSMLILLDIVCLALIAVGIHAIVTDSVLMMVRKVPVVTGLVIVVFCAVIWFLLRTKLGQDFRSVGQNQHIAEVQGINVDRTRIIATIISTVLAGWGMVIYQQNMGTLNVYGAHTNIGMFSVAALLVGGASTSKATISHAIIGAILFNAMFIISPEVGAFLFGEAQLDEYFRTFITYGIIGVALGLYVWKAAKKSRITLDE